MFRLRLAAAAAGFVLCVANLTPAVASSVTWVDGRWQDERGNVWLEDREVWWHPVKNIYYIDGYWRNGLGQYWNEAAARWAWFGNAAASAQVGYQPSSTGVERWRSLVTEIFGAGQVDTVLQLIACESAGNPNATGSSGERGLMQIHPMHYDSTYDSRGNLLAAYRLSNGGTNWSPWTCS